MCLRVLADRMTSGLDRGVTWAGAALPALIPRLWWKPEAPWRVRRDPAENNLLHILRKSPETPALETDYDSTIDFPLTFYDLGHISQHVSKYPFPGSSLVG